MTESPQTDSQFSEFLFQVPTQEPLKTMMNLLERYKTVRCSDTECKYNKERPFSTDALLLYDCFNFHSKSDHRRPVFLKTVKNKSQNIRLIYSANVALEVLLELKSNESSQKHCLNGYEYLYHPLNYKTKSCSLNKSTGCNNIYCPYYHNEEEQVYFENYRKVLDQDKNKLPVVEEIQNNVNKINDLVKKTNVEVKNGEGSNSKLKKAKSNDEVYIYDETVKFIEDHYHEFKCLKLHLDTVIKYICGFLNSKGGTLYFGINNDGVIKGTDVKEFEIQGFKKKLYDSLKKFVPPVTEDEVKVDFVQVYKVNGKGTGLVVMPNSYVVEICMKKPAKNDLYFTNYRECFAKRSASINQLKTKEIKEYIRTFTQRKNAEALQGLQTKMDHYEGKDLGSVSLKELEKLEKQLLSTLGKIDDKLGEKAA